MHQIRAQATGDPTPAEQISCSGERGACELFLDSVAMCKECSLLRAQANCTFSTRMTQRHPNPANEWRK